MGKAMSAGDDAAGGYLIPVQQIPGFIELIRANSVVLTAGATLLDNLTGSRSSSPSKRAGACQPG